MTELSRNEQIKLAAKKDSYWRGVWRRLKQNRLAMISLVILAIIILACIFVPMFSGYSMYQTAPAEANQAPNAQHLFGTDKIGRDLFVRLFYGGRISLGVAVAVISWPSIARIVRGQILSLREMDYMEACRALGISNKQQIFKHLFPNVLAYIIVYVTLSMASVILTETSLSFLGLGVNPPTPTWGNLIQEARNLLVLQQKWWYWIPPGISIFLTILCFNILGDGLRDAIDPKMQK